ncbi:hypothetical protein OESDEN_02831 [Oesophagostomum dentatum]|uniref:Uncharacterized protein n=1 Tax=Oesophagostomum dentatum TaxID=61180 RepID=A0A0B1TI44_OESDE|nr:hypothetical protein OESDEN_02831 [Oesophagostomum dentatum]
MDERTQLNVLKDVNDFSSPDRRADFWKVRIVRQPLPATKVYLFPSVLEWLNERPQLTVNAALMKKEEELGLKPQEELVGSPEQGPSQNIGGDPLTLYVAGHTKNRPAEEDIINFLRRSYTEFYKRTGQSCSRELVSLIDACLVLNQTAFAGKISEENNYEHDLLQIQRTNAGNEKWDDYTTTVMLRLAAGGTPSKELWEAATVTRLLCEIIAGPTSRRRAAIAEMAAHELKLTGPVFRDALVLAKLFLPDDVVCEELMRECSQLFQKTDNADVNNIVR